MKLEGKVGIILGAARGIGKGYAKALLQKQTKVCICDINEEEGKKSLEEFQGEFGQDSTIFRKVDATKQEEITDAFKSTKEHFGRLDIAVNNVGSIDETNWQRPSDLNLGTAIRITQAALGVMGKDQGGEGGAVVHTASNAGLEPAFYAPVYSATKAAVIMYCRAYTHPMNFEKHGLRMVCLCPTFVQTNFLMDNAEESKLLHFETLVESIIAKQDSGLLSVESVANAMIQMLEDDSMKCAAAQMITETPVFLFKD